ncbi:E3 UFM1-protein ligase 1 homolog [Aristolochia californica]|uniref:E3 UFM1-protein ligase 1 homolog n=1 Tax=Aristolochia californica TaxID=171875 RepID=UPI0035E0B349
MDDELFELQKQFEFAQQAKSSVRLSERNVVELVHKLQQLQIIDFELLHTISGKEYITPNQLRLEIETEVKKLGRVALIDLADIIGVDLYHVENQSQQIVADDPGLMLIQGEIISQSYWDAISEEINERLQECSQISLPELAVQLHVSSELVASVLEPRLGTLVKGRLEGGQLYTPAYITRISGMVRGATRGITVPTNLSTIWSSLQQLLVEMNGGGSLSVEGALFQSLFSGLLKEGEILGSLRAGIHWTPAVFAHAQRESVDSFFSQNSFINYDALYKLAISQPRQYLQSRYPEGIPLETVFAHPSVVEMLDSAVEDVIQQGSWIDCLSVLPTVYGSEDASKLLSLCPSIQKATKSLKATVMAESCVLSNNFIKDVFDQLDKEMKAFIHTSHAFDSSHSVNEAKVGADHVQLSTITETTDSKNGDKVPLEKGSKRKKGKSGGSYKAAPTEDSSVIQENLSTKSKKNLKKQKEASSLQVSDARSAGKKETDKVKDEGTSLITEDWIIQKMLALFPDFEGLGGEEGTNSLVRALTTHLRPMLLNSWKERRAALFMEHVERRRHLLDNLQKKLDERFLDMQLYEKALDLFEDDPPISVILHKHLLRATASSMLDMLLLNLDIDNKLKNGIQVEESETAETSSLTSAERISLAKSLPGSLSLKSISAVEALDGKRVDTFMTALRAIAEESGLMLKKLDKKLERPLLHSYRKDLTSKVSSETDPVALLPKVVSLLYVQLYGKALQAPGRAISVAVSKLKDKLEVGAHKVLVDYHTATVSLLALQSAATEDEEDCTSDRKLSKREYLETRMSELKGLVLNSNQS